MTMFRLLWVGIWLLIAQPASTQDDPPLRDQVLALNTVEQDAIILYDVAQDRYRRVSIGVGAHHVWDFSADGCRLLFTYSTDNRWGRLYSMALDGSDLREMVQYPDLAPERWGIWEADWSGEGERIAFTLRRQQSDGELTHHIAYVTADDPTVRFYSVTGSEYAPTWSPDGQWLAYLSYQERVAGVNVMATALPTAEPPPGQTPIPAVTVNEADLWVVSADAEIKYQLTNLRVGSVSQPNWSLDGELLSFVWSPQNSSDMVWMIANQPAAIPTQLSYEWAMVLATDWLPDSTGIIGAMREFRETRSNVLWQIPLVTTDDTLATRYLASLDIPHADFPRFSPDGRWLAVRSAYEMVLVDLMDSSTRTLDNSVQGNSAGVWSPQAFSGEADC
ncbi:MAG: hypothetical protein ACFE0Q_04960 [Anaerolineae bacterium]